MDSHGSDDSETFATPPGSMTAEGESDRLEPEGEEDDAVGEDKGGDEWKSIIDKVSETAVRDSRRRRVKRVEIQCRWGFMIYV